MSAKRASPFQPAAMPLTPQIILQREDDEHDLQRACCLELDPAAAFGARHIAAVVRGLHGMAR
jgi:hypothetical protein